MALVHISEAEATRDSSGLLARVRAGDEIVIDNDAAPAVILRIAAQPSLRRLSDALQLAQERRSTITLDRDVSSDLEAIIESHPEPLEDAWTGQ